MPAMRGSELAGQQIIDAIHGRHLGNVEEVYYDAYLVAVTAVSLGYDVSGAHGIIARDDIVMCGTDAVLVKHSNVAIVADHLPAEWLGRTNLLGTEVRALDGQRLGTLVDLAVDRHRLLLTSLVVRLDQVLVDGQGIVELSVSAIRALSFDHKLVVDAHVEEDRLITH